MTESEWAPRVAVDARALYASGIGRYLRELLAEWCRTGPFARLTLLGDPPLLRAFLAEHPTTMPTRVVEHRGTAYSAAAQWSWLAGARTAANADEVTFFPHWDAPVLSFPARSVVTVHDLTPFRVPDAFGRGKRTVGRIVLDRVLVRAAAILCVSQATADDLEAADPTLAERVHVVPNGVGSDFRDAGGGDNGGEPPVAGTYLLWVGMLKPHKNPAAALDVLARIRANGRPDVRLVVVGRTFPELSLPDLVDARGLRDAVVVLGEVDDAVLRRLYAGAGALLFPSRAEGFGFPVLEAMAVGTPVIASDIPALVEIADGAAALFAPDDVAGMAEATFAVLCDPCRRAAAVARGRARAATFTWTASAGRTAAVLAHVARSAARASSTVS